MEENEMSLSADVSGREMFGGAREYVCVAWRRDKKNKVQECPYKRVEKPKLIRLEGKGEGKAIKLLNVYYGWQHTRCFTYTFASKSYDNLVR